MNNTKYWKIDTSSLIRGTRPQIIKHQTYEEDGSVLKIKMKLDRLDKGKRHIGIKICLEATYKGDDGFEGVSAYLPSKGKRPGISTYYRFGDEPNEIWMYNEWMDLQRGNLGDHLRDMKYLDVELTMTNTLNIFTC